MVIKNSDMVGSIMKISKEIIFRKISKEMVILLFQIKECQRLMQQQDLNGKLMNVIFGKKAIHVSHDFNPGKL